MLDTVHRGDRQHPVHRFAEHLGNLIRYRNAEARHIGLDIKTRGFPQTLEPTKAMQKALGSPAVAEHAVACRKTATDLSALVLHRELHHKRMEIIEALYTGHNRTINKDDGVVYFPVIYSIQTRNM
ncbi:hypothetical protein M513_07798 [Trichuris suis]|uniref:Uncharacterized protein n=1 Tax=Trichuris suis TaxID=68888 RepID=A0A085M2E7_9BILA|nr:hypothetical protein M513_07798 [Trichuris suis]